jgi:hypothetical protein
MSYTPPGWSPLDQHMHEHGQRLYDRVCAGDDVDVEAETLSAWVSGPDAEPDRP